MLNAEGCHGVALPVRGGLSEASGQVLEMPLKALTVPPERRLSQCGVPARQAPMFVWTEPLGPRCRGVLSSQAAPLRRLQGLCQSPRTSKPTRGAKADECKSHRKPGQGRAATQGPQEAEKTPESSQTAWSGLQRGCGGHPGHRGSRAAPNRSFLSLA